MDAKKAAATARLNNHFALSARFNQAINVIDTRIEEEAREGKFYTVAQFKTDNLWFDCGCTESLKSHFEEKGFEVNTDLSVDEEILFFGLKWEHY